MDNIKMQPVVSGIVSFIGYSDGHLYVKFNTGKLYEYHNISEEDYEKILESPSIGAMLKKVILDKIYLEIGLQDKTFKRIKYGG